MAVKKNTLLIVAGSLYLLLIGVTILLISEKQNQQGTGDGIQLEKKTLKINTQTSPDNMTN